MFSDFKKNLPDADQLMHRCCQVHCKVAVLSARLQPKVGISGMGFKNFPLFVETLKKIDNEQEGQGMLSPMFC